VLESRLEVASFADEPSGYSNKRRRNQSSWLAKHVSKSKWICLLRFYILASLPVFFLVCGNRINEFIYQMKIE
jgi:hypothetical protein